MPTLNIKITHAQKLKWEKPLAKRFPEYAFNLETLVIKAVDTLVDMQKLREAITTSAPIPAKSFGRLTRFCLKSDDDGHEYCIPVSQEEEFDALLEKGDSDGYRAFEDRFGTSRLSMHHSAYSFIDFRETIKPEQVPAREDGS